LCAKNFDLPKGEEEIAVDSSGSITGGISTAGQCEFNWDEARSASFSWNSATYGSFLWAAERMTPAA
jgi:hypothetical protein